MVWWQKYFGLRQRAKHIKSVIHGRSCNPNYWEEGFWGWLYDRKPIWNSLQKVCNISVPSTFIGSRAGVKKSVTLQILPQLVVFNYSCFWGVRLENGLQWLPMESLQVLFYETKVPYSEWYCTIWKCCHTIQLQNHSYHTLALSKEVCNFTLSQGSQKLLAKVKM